MMRRLPTFLIVASAVYATPSTASAGTRELACRGGPGLKLEITANPSPHDKRYIRMTLRYNVATQPAGLEYQNLQPGTCSWTQVNFPDMPKEPGYVVFDMYPESQHWFAPEKRELDTTVAAAAFFPDTISLPRYLARTDKYWHFYVDDQTNFSISFGAWKETRTLPTYVTVTGPFGKPVAAAPAPAPQPPSPVPPPPEQKPPTGTGVGGARKPGATSTAAVAKLATLSFKGVDRRPDGFTVRFSARPNASATVAYSTEKPVNTPQGWYFSGAAVQGSGAVSRGGQSAEVSEAKSSSLFSNYSGSTRLAPQRGTSYNFLITVEGGNGPREQYVGQLTTMQMNVDVYITELTVTKKSFDQGVRRDIQVYRSTSNGFQYCDSGGCDNVTGVIGLLVYARPDFGGGSPDPRSWTVQPGKNSGVGKMTMDTRLIKLDRPTRAFTIKSVEGADVEFEAIGEVNVKWR